MDPPLPHLPAPHGADASSSGKIATALHEERLSQLGFDPMPPSSDAFAKHVTDEVNKWSNVVKEQGIHIN
jgi:hypothetical protein